MGPRWSKQTWARSETSGRQLLSSLKSSRQRPRASRRSRLALRLGMRPVGSSASHPSSRHRSLPKLAPGSPCSARRARTATERWRQPCIRQGCSLGTLPWVTCSVGPFLSTASVASSSLAASRTPTCSTQPKAGREWSSLMSACHLSSRRSASAQMHSPSAYATGASSWRFLAGSQPTTLRRLSPMPSSHALCTIIRGVLSAAGHPFKYNLPRRFFSRGWKAPRLVFGSHMERAAPTFPIRNPSKQCLMDSWPRSGMWTTTAPSRRPTLTIPTVRLMALQLCAPRTAAILQ
mmetsp:Transcript_6579/g.19817  ORF Transcript_6579/g.19817 Transcript_6579/m.19817 type:complete len:291 (+) Transcript_6579:545-1417(+)